MSIFTKASKQNWAAQLQMFDKPIMVSVGKSMRKMCTLLGADTIPLLPNELLQYDTMGTTHDPRRMWWYNPISNKLHLCSRPYECVYLLTDDDMHNLKSILSLDARLAYLGDKACTG